MVALLAFVGLVLNMGLFLVERRHLQNAADAMALAATWQVLDEQTSRVFGDLAVRAEAVRLATENEVSLPGDNQVVGPARSLVANYVDQNGVDLGLVQVGSPMPTASAGVRIHINGRFDTLLAAFVGQDRIQVSADGEARLISVVAPVSLDTFVPLAVPQAAFLSAVISGDNSYDLHSLANPYLDLTNVAPPPASPDMHTNLQYWSDGGHAVGVLANPSSVDFVTPTDPGYASDVQTGLLDNWRGQGMLPYIIITLPLCKPCSGPVTVVGFARFYLAHDQITLTTLRGYFVPFVNDPAAFTRQPGGPLSGPSAVVLTR